MEVLQRSATSFRRQGSSGLIWDDKLLNAQLDKLAAADHQRREAPPPPPAGLKIERSRSDGGLGSRAEGVSTDIDPPSPKVSACGFCAAFGISEKTRRRAGKRVM